MTIIIIIILFYFIFFGGGHVKLAAGYHPVRSVAATAGSEYAILAADGGPGGTMHIFDTRRPRGLNAMPVRRIYRQSTPSPCQRHATY